MEKVKFEKNRRLDSLTRFFKNNILKLKNLNKIIFVFIIVLGIYYIAGTNDLAIKGYSLSDLKQKRNKLADENKKLELEAMSLSSYNILSERIGKLKMVAVGEIDYISGGDEIVAKK